MANLVWQPPRLRLEAEETSERRATWLELFYDLVFVAAIAELAHTLAGNVSIWGAMSFFALFIPVWWCWVGAAFYATRFDTDDLSYRLLTLVQMAIVAAMAVNIHHGTDSTSVHFALTYVAFRSVLVLQYLNAGYHIPIARSLAIWYSCGFGLSLALWALSVFVPPPWRFVLWGLGLLADFATPLTAGQRVAQLPPNMSHIPERMGLFVIIVLGESIVAVVSGLAQQDWSGLSSLVAVLGLAIAFCLWWLYFDSVDGSPLQAMQTGRMGVSLLWLYSHLPLAMGLTAVGVGVEHAIASTAKGEFPPPDRWLLCGAVAVCLSVLASIHIITCRWGNPLCRPKTSSYRLLAALLALGVAVVGSRFSPLAIVGILAATCAWQVALDFSMTKSK
jgi:low temperature requirement protein LtrA